MRTGELYECVESPFSYSRSWGYTPSRILLYDGWLRHRLLNELFRSLKNSAFHRLSRSVNLEYYAFLVFSNLSNRNDSIRFYFDYFKVALIQNFLIRFYRQEIFCNHIYCLAVVRIFCRIMPCVISRASNSWTCNPDACSACVNVSKPAAPVIA